MLSIVFVTGGSEHSSARQRDTQQKNGKKDTECVKGKATTTRTIKPTMNEMLQACRPNNHDQIGPKRSIVSAICDHLVIKGE